MIAGVCGGLGEYLRIDPTLVRLFFVLLGIAGNGIGAIVYVLLWVILPLEGNEKEASFEETIRYSSAEIAQRAQDVGDELREMVRHPNPQTGLIIGGALVLSGIVFLLQNLHLPWLTWLDFDVIWPILLIVGGIALLVRNRRGE